MLWHHLGTFSSAAMDGWALSLSRKKHTVRQHSNLGVIPKRASRSMIAGDRARFGTAAQRGVHQAYAGWAAMPRHPPSISASNYPVFQSWPGVPFTSIAYHVCSNLRRNSYVCFELWSGYAFDTPRVYAGVHVVRAACCAYTRRHARRMHHRHTSTGAYSRHTGVLHRLPPAYTHRHTPGGIPGTAAEYPRWRTPAYHWSNARMLTAWYIAAGMRHEVVPALPPLHPKPPVWPLGAHLSTPPRSAGGVSSTGGEERQPSETSLGPLCDGNEAFLFQLAKAQAQLLG